jgi:hypothetical protein
LGRHSDPKAQFTVKVNITNGGYKYACTQPPTIDQSTGKKQYRRVQWGVVDDNLKFIPGSRFYLASPEERSQLIFPENWDLSEAEKLNGLRKPGRPVCDGLCQNRLYGDIWLLEQVAIKTGIRRDLEVVFDNNQEIVEDILTLAMFPYLTKLTYNHVSEWQRIVETPSSRELTPSVITRLTQSITEQNRKDLLRLRSLRLGKDEVCAVDSTTRSAYGESLADIKWGKNKEGLPLPQTTEVIVYTLTSHMPVYYRTFEGNIPDNRTVNVILKDLEYAGFKNLILVTDRGYETIHNLESFILRNQSLIMATKVNNKHVLNAINSIKMVNSEPESMSLDNFREIYYKQFDIFYEFNNNNHIVSSSNKLKLNLYFDLHRKFKQLIDIGKTKNKQKCELDQLILDKKPLGDDNEIKNKYNYFIINYDSKSRVPISYELNNKIIHKETSAHGFFAIMTNKIDLDPMTVYNTYRLRDEQEKLFHQMKSDMVSDRQRNWSEAGKTGRLFILFVSLILSSYVRHIWKSTFLCDKLTSSWKILSNMRSIRRIKHTNRAKMITPFVGIQVDICKAFGFEIPDGCAPLYASRPQLKRKRGRPPKKKGD